MQLPIEHEGRTAGYWWLGKDSLKVMRETLCQLRLLIIHEVSMLSNLNLAYVHLRLDEIFGKDEWFGDGGVNVLFVGDILQLLPVNGAPVFEVRRGCPSQQTVEVLKARVIQLPVVDTFESLLGSNKSPLCLFLTQKACQEFNAHMLSRLDADVTEIPCIDKVDETASTYTWSKRATEEMKKLNSDCNLTAGLEAVLQEAVGARVMLHRNVEIS